MKLEKIIEYGETPAQVMDKFVKTCNSDSTLQSGNWKLVSAQIGQGLISPSNSFYPGKMVFFAVGIFQKLSDTNQLMNSNSGDQKESEDLTKYCFCDNPTKYNPEDKYCRECSGLVEDLDDPRYCLCDTPKLRMPDDIFCDWCGCLIKNPPEG